MQQPKNAAAEIFGRKQWVRPDAAMQARLDAQVLTGRRTVLDVRPDCREDSGMAYCGRPRNPKPTRRVKLSQYDAYNTWQG